MKRAFKQAINFNPDSVTRFPALHSVRQFKGNINFRFFWYSGYKLCEYSKYTILRGQYFYVAYGEKTKQKIIIT